MSRRFLPKSTEAEHLDFDAHLIAKGNIEAFERLFLTISPFAWGIAFAVTESMEAAAGSMIEGISTSMRPDRIRSSGEDTATRVLRTTYVTSVQRVRSSGSSTKYGPHLLKAKSDEDDAATFGFTSLDRRRRVALWLVDGVLLTITRTSRLLDAEYDDIEASYNDARRSLRDQYLRSLTEQSEVLNDDCLELRGQLVAYVEQTLDRSEAGIVERHLEACESCRGLALRLGDVTGLLNAAIPSMPQRLGLLTKQAWMDQLPSDLQKRNSRATVPVVPKASANEADENVSESFAIDRSQAVDREPHDGKEDDRGGYVLQPRKLAVVLVTIAVVGAAFGTALRNVVSQNDDLPAAYSPAPYKPASSEWVESPEPGTPENNPAISQQPTPPNKARSNQPTEPSYELKDLPPVPTTEEAGQH